MTRLSPKQRINLTKILFFAGSWLAFGLVYTFIEQGLLGNSPVYPSTQNPYNFQSAIVVIALGSISLGLILGTLEVLTFKRFIKLSFGQKIVLKTVIYLTSIVLFLLIIGLVNNSVRLDRAPLHPEVIATMKAFFFNFAFWSIVIYAGVCISITLFVAEVADNLGLNVLRNFMTGRYHRPREEDRIFMFLDMKASTTLAEKLGHSTYYQLLNQYYADLTDAILNTKGEIYQYVGDEIVVSWELERGLENNNCISCFFQAKEIISKEAEFYQKAFGVVPDFKAGIHYGTVTTGEVGVVKKDILFTGDVLNTTARIQGFCNQLGVDLLISKELCSRLELISHYEAVEMGEKELRGREATIQLYTLKPKQ